MQVGLAYHAIRLLYGLVGVLVAAERRTMDHELDDLIGKTYDVASGEGNWLEYGEALAAFGQAHAVAIHLKQADGTYENITQIQGAAWEAYSQYYSKIDPFKEIATRPPDRSLPSVDWIGQFGHELVPDSEFLNSEYFADFARPNGQRYSITTKFGPTDLAMMALYRDERASPFDLRDLQNVHHLFPHLKRGLRLFEILRTRQQAGTLGLAVLDASPLSIILVDASLRVLFANRVADRLVAGGRSALRMTRSGPTTGTGPPRLAVVRPVDAAVIKALVVSVAVRRGAGGAIRLKPPILVDAGAGELAVMVSPVPARLATATPSLARPGRSDGVAMIIARDLNARELPSASLLADLFHLSPGESAVGLALLGGHTADQVARLRGVSIDTVRRQIRTLLEKTGVHNLRDFERLMATLTGMQTRPLDGAE